LRCKFSYFFVLIYLTTTVFKERRPRRSRPCGVPDCAVQKMGRPETRYAQTAVLLFPFSVPHNRRLHMGTTKVNGNPNVKSNVKSNIKFNSNVITTAAYILHTQTFNRFTPPQPAKAT
ncbi:MAG: hypothetical protein V4495_07120, partial [Pseudomonadota bacterium]